ncbi:unnamed protein product [Cylindrotheca closterium]|uniref:Uncharacterized protein n=1 Tax=Cylindrotheca closterium TaxID=2856 RepID=A0AAD2FHH4_9STRA|nr:unnamed protein product [Cylindrotheca closterium]
MRKSDEENREEDSGERNSTLQPCRNGTDPPILLLSDISVIVHIRDKASGTYAPLCSRSFQELFHQPSIHYELSEPLLLPTRLSGDFRDHFCKSFEECQKFPQRVSDELGVSMRLWRKDTNKSFCLCNKEEPSEVAGFKTTHKRATLFPIVGANEDEELLESYVNCFILPTFPPSYDRNIHNWSIDKVHGWKQYDIDDWKTIRYSISSFQFGITKEGGFKTVDEILEWLNVLDWE